jgi:hypothetical protein
VDTDGPTRQAQVGLQVGVQVGSVPPTDHWAPKHAAHLSLTSRLKYLVHKKTQRRSVKTNHRRWMAKMLSGGRSDGPCWLIAVEAHRRGTNYTFRLDVGVRLGARSRGIYTNVYFV